MESTATKRSKQRERIFQVLRTTRSHPTAEWVYEQVRVQMPRISLGTVYRNLHILTRQKRIQELDFGEGTRRYDASINEHYHFVCERCGSVSDLEVEPLQDLNERIDSSIPGIVRSHRLDFFGVCSKCLQSE